MKTLTTIIALIFLNTSALARLDPLNPSLVYGSTAVYQIKRNGKNIGTHTIQFIPEGSNFDVEIESRIKIDFLKFPVYSFIYRARENWVEGKLRSIKVEIKENKKTQEFNFDGFGQPATIPNGQEANPNNDRPYISDYNLKFASNHWHPGVLSNSVVYNTLTGNINRIDVKMIGFDTLKISDQELTVKHYRYSGELELDVWYDSLDRWVKLNFKNEDGSTITYTAKGFEAHAG